MTRVLFVCQGNTCRSPIAEGIARRIFGANHSVASAGLETADGQLAAKHARTVAKEFRFDLSSHRTRGIDSFNLIKFDVIVPMDSATAMAIQPPPGVRKEPFEVADPYGKPMEEYRATAREIQRSVRRLYASETLQRLKSASPPLGSHALGIVVRAAKEFEKETAPIVTTWCPKTKTEKLPLGRLAVELARCASNSSDPNASTVRSLARVMVRVNKSWVQLKHQDDPPLSELVKATELIISGFDFVAASGPHN